MANARTKATRPASPKAAKTSSAGTKPLVTCRSGNVSAAVFPNDSVSIRRSYRSKAGEWKYTSALWRRDIPDAIKALNECHTASAVESGTDSE